MAWRCLFKAGPKYHAVDGTLHRIRCDYYGGGGIIGQRKRMVATVDQVIKMIT